MTKTFLPPVILQTNYIKTTKQIELGALWDLASTDDYIRNDTAKKLGLKGIPVTLVVEAIKGHKSVQETMLYDVPVYTGRHKKRMYKCYGLDEITSGSDIPKGYDDLCAKFGKAPGVMRRQGRIDILVSMRRHRDHPKLTTTISDMSIFDGPFGPLFGGSDRSLRFTPHHLSCLVKRLQGAISAVTLRAAVKSVSLVNSLKSEREFLNNFEKETFGVDERPKCDEFLDVKKMSKVSSSTVKDVDILDNGKEMARKVHDNDDDKKEILPSYVFTGSAGKNAPGPSSQGGLGEEAAFAPPHLPEPVPRMGSLSGCLFQGLYRSQVTRGWICGTLGGLLQGGGRLVHA